jgi:hypothetical protein
MGCAVSTLETRCLWNCGKIMAVFLTTLRYQCGMTLTLDIPKNRKTSKPLRLCLLLGLTLILYLKVANEFVKTAEVLTRASAEQIEQP